MRVLTTDEMTFATTFHFVPFVFFVFFIGSIGTTAVVVVCDVLYLSMSGDGWIFSQLPRSLFALIFGASMLVVES